MLGPTAGESVKTEHFVHDRLGSPYRNMWFVMHRESWYQSCLFDRYW